jgi:hypothetical protein
VASTSACLLWRHKEWPIISYAERGSERKAVIDSELQELWQRIYRVDARQDQDWRKQERYCRQQREVLRALEDLCAGYMRHLFTESRFDNDSCVLQRPFFRTDSRCSQSRERSAAKAATDSSAPELVIQHVLW